MNRLLVFNDRNEIEIVPEAMGIDVFYNIWTRDKDPNKQLAIKELSYVWYMESNSLLNPYKKEYLDVKVRHTKIMEDVFPNNSTWKPDKLIADAIVKYRELNYSFNVEYIQSAKTAASATMEYFNGIDYNECNDKGVYKYKIKEVLSALKETSTIIKELENLQELVENELNSSDARIRGGERLGGFEK